MSDRGWVSTYSSFLVTHPAEGGTDTYEFQIWKLGAVTEALEGLLDARCAHAVGYVYQAG